MELIKRQISLEKSRNRSDIINDLDPNKNNGNWGKLTATTFNVRVFLTQNIDDMGIFTDMEYIKQNVSTSNVDYTILIDKLKSISATDFKFIEGKVPVITNLTSTEQKTLRLTGKSEIDYFSFGELPVTGLTDSKIEDLRTYSNTDPFKVDFAISVELYKNYKDLLIAGVDKITSLLEPRVYVFDAPINNDLGTNKQIHGLRYIEYTGQSRQKIVNGVRIAFPTTIVNYIGQGWNQTNTSLSALTKEDYLFGIVSRPEVESDIFIDRGITKVMDLHLRLSEIGNMGELMNHGNGFYKINKQ